MHRGYIKLWRKTLDGGLIKNYKVFIFWVWCLLKTNHKKDFKQTAGYQEIFLQPGEFVFGLKSASDETGLTIQNIRTCLTFLKKSKNLTIKTTNKFSIISIINWGTYQQEYEDDNNQINTCLTSIQQASNNKQEYNNIRTKELNKEYNIIPKDILDFSQNFIEFISKTKNTLSPKSKNLLSESCKTIDQLITVDGFDLEYIRKVILWAVDDDFWSGNIFSLSGLRSKKKGDPRTKFQKIAASYETSGKPRLNSRSAKNLKACNDFISED